MKNLFLGLATILMGTISIAQVQYSDNFSKAKKLWKEEGYSYDADGFETFKTRLDVEDLEAVVRCYKNTDNTIIDPFRAKTNEEWLKIIDNKSFSTGWFDFDNLSAYVFVPVPIYYACLANDIPVTSPGIFLRYRLVVGDKELELNRSQIVTTSMPGISVKGKFTSSSKVMVPQPGNKKIVKENYRDRILKFIEPIITKTEEMQRIRMTVKVDVVNEKTGTSVMEVGEARLSFKKPPSAYHYKYNYFHTHRNINKYIEKQADFHAELEAKLNADIGNQNWLKETLPDFVKVEKTFSFKYNLNLCDDHKGGYRVLGVVYKTTSGNLRYAELFPNQTKDGKLTYTERFGDYTSDETELAGITSVFCRKYVSSSDKVEMRNFFTGKKVLIYLHPELLTYSKSKSGELTSKEKAALRQKQIRERRRTGGQ
jgi:hypothetical protein